MNMDVNGVYHVSPYPSTHWVEGPMRMAVPEGRLWRNSPGMSPSSHTDRESAGSAPIPWTKTQTTTHAAMRATVTTGVRSVGLSSR